MLHRVQKLLSNYGYCSRRKAEKLIEQGRVKVNGKKVSLGDKAGEEDRIFVDNKLVKKEKSVYIMFNKPAGCVTALSDKRLKTIMDYIKIKERVFPIGRLDYNTSGLLLLTNDGDFANKVMHPRHEIRKTYFVKLNKPISEKELALIEKGIELEDGKTSPAKARKISEKALELTIHEGKKRIVRRIFERLGYTAIYLQRIRIGNLGLGKLKQGRFRYLTERGIERIFSKK
jgi:pseudouridine synthase